MLLFALLWSSSTFNSHMTSCRTTTQCGARTVHLPDWWRTSLGFIFCLIDSSFCMAPAFICMLHSLLLRRGRMLLFDDLLSAFDWGWGHFTLFYYLMCVHTTYFNCCIHTLILQINAVPLNQKSHLKLLICSYFFFYWSCDLQHHQVSFGTEYIQITQLSIFSAETTAINLLQSNKS